MALSMAALLIPIFLLLGAYKIFFSGDAPIAVDTTQTFAAARHDARFPILEPSGLATEWKATSSTFTLHADGSVLRIGYVPPDRSGIQLIESDRPVDRLLPEELGSGAQPGNLITIGNRLWRGYPVVGDGNRALVLAEDRRTTVLVGTGSEADLRTLAASLR
jgi:hypothetical protein